jgi:hypothetical protein
MLHLSELILAVQQGGSGFAWSCRGLKW